MTIEIIDKGKNTGAVMFKSTNSHFISHFNGYTECPKALMYQEMLRLATWVNNEASEECVFTMD